jgi:hypothetical protein
MEGGPGRWGWGQFPAGVSVSRGADRYLNSARLLCMWERTSPTSICRSDPGSGLAYLRQRFVLGNHDAKQGQLAPLHCWLTNRINIPTAINRASRVPTANDRARLRRSSGFDPAPFCAAPMPSQKSRLPIDRYLATRRLAWALSAVQTSAEACPGQQSLQPPAARMEAPQSLESPPELVLATAAIADLAPGTAAAPLQDQPPTQVAARGWRKRRWHRRCLRWRRQEPAAFWRICSLRRSAVCLVPIRGEMRASTVQVPPHSSARFAQRDLWNVEPSSWDQSGLMLAARITLPHFWV